MAGSTRAIAAELGVAHATVHYTFGTKEDLYHAVLKQLTDDLVAEVEQAAPENGDFAETIAALAAALWRTVREEPANYQLLNELSMCALRTPRLREVLGDHYRDLIQVTTDLVARTARRIGQELAQPAEAVARFFLAGLDGLTVRRFALTDEAAEAACLRALVSSVVALADGRTRTLRPAAVTCSRKASGRAPASPARGRRSGGQEVCSASTATWPWVAGSCNSTKSVSRRRRVGRPVDGQGVTAAPPGAQPDRTVQVEAEAVGGPADQLLRVARKNGEVIAWSGPTGGLCRRVRTRRAPPWAEVRGGFRHGLWRGLFCRCGRSGARAQLGELTPTRACRSWRASTMSSDITYSSAYWTATRCCSWSG